MLKKIKWPIIFGIGLLVILLFASSMEYISASLFKSLLTAFTVIVLNFALFAYSISKSDGKSNKIFMIYVMGGMGVRILLMLIIIFIVINYLKVDAYAFIFALLVLYVFLLIFEINLVKDYSNSRNKE